MRPIILGLAACCCLQAAKAQQPFEIKGNIGHYSAPAKAYLLYRLPSGDSTRQDSVTMNNGRFGFKGSVTYPLQAYLVIDPGGAGVRKGKNISFYLEPGTISVNGKDSIESATVTGGQMNADFNQINQSLKPVKLKEERLSREYAAASKEKRKELEKQFDSLEAPTKAVYLEFIRQHPDHLMSLAAIKIFGGYVPKFDEVEPLFNALSPEVRTSALGNKYAEELNKLKVTAMGAIAPDFTQPDTSGKKISLHDFKGKYVMIDFWASWCGPCRAENPTVVKAYQKYKDKGFEILGVSMDDVSSKTAWLKAIHDDALSWTQVSDLTGFKNQVAALYSVNAIPQNFIIGPDGKIVARNLRGEQLDKTLSEIFK